MKVLYMNNYSLDDSLQLCRDGTYHSLHLWGYDYFMEHADTQAVPLDPAVVNSRKNLLIDKFIGDVGQEKFAFKVRNEYDVIVSAHINVITGLGYLKRFFKMPPLVGVLHSIPVCDSAAKRAFMRMHLSGIDRITCIAMKDYRFLIDDLGFSEQKVHYTPCGGKVEDFDRIIKGLPAQAVSDSPYAVSIGKSQRDYNTLINAYQRIANTNVEMRIFCGGATFDGVSGSDSNVQLCHNLIDFPEAVRQYRDSEFIVIPIVDCHRTLGLTSVIDAMALGKPFIVTRNPGIDLDVEKKGVGLFATPGDALDMQRKIEYLLSNPDKAKEFGENGRRYLQEQMSYKGYCERLFSVASDLVTEQSANSLSRNTRSLT